MPELSAAVIVLAGAVLVLAGVLPSPLTEASRQRVAGLGYLFCGLGLLAWLFAFFHALPLFTRAG